jgi:RNA polymerase sigma-70 factor (sigma-E family)
VGITELRHPDRGLLSAAGPAGSSSTAMASQDTADQVSLLYQMHGMDLVRIAAVMLGSRAAAEDAVHDAFCGLFRRWDQLSDQGNALSYVRSAVINRCRSELRQRTRLARRADQMHRPLDADSPEQAAILGEEHRDVLTALARLPLRQRETLVLRYFLDLPEAEIAAAMGISPGTVKSTTSRAIAALGRLLKEQS